MFNTDNTDYTRLFCDRLNDIILDCQDDNIQAYKAFCDNISRVYYNGIELLTLTELKRFLVLKNIIE